MQKRQKSFVIVPALIAIGIGAAVITKYSDWVVVPKKREPILAVLKDPASAQFRNEHISKSGAMCGEVNAKNSMGGYIGFKRYISAGPDGDYLEEHAPLRGWTDADVTRRKALESKIFVRFVDRQKEFPGLEAPTGEALESLAEKEFFKARWNELCESGDVAKT